MNRQDILNQLRDNPDISVLIIGGGINGVGTFRDLALQGVDVLLVERDDFSSGASAGSSHMLHGGIRYLENGEFRLVREALKERNLLLHNAPHYAKPLPTTIPMYKWFSGLFNAPLKFVGLMSKPSERGAMVIKIGLMFYDWFTRQDKTMPNHTFRMRGSAIRFHPEINLNIVCSATYYDAQIPYPERLALELILDAEAANSNARALNYMPVVDARDGDSVVLQDRMTGEEVVVRPQIVVNAAGPWIDFVNQAMNKQTQFIGGTKGSHLILDHPDLYAACNGTEMFFENEDGRIVLIFPFVDGRVMIGTTDIRIEDPDEAVCTEDEINYMLEMVPKVFPKIKVERSQIVFSFSGVRPLPYSDASYTGNVSRDHSVETVEPNGLKFPIYSLVGGKWTTFRAFSEHVADKVLGALNKPRQNTTENTPIGGGKNYPLTEQAKTHFLEDLKEKTGLDSDRLTVLFDRYGTRATEIAEFISQGDDAPLKHKSDFSKREIIFLVQMEKTQHLDDLILRRSLLAMLGYITPSFLDELAVVMGEALGWSKDQQQEEIARTRKVLSEKHLVELS